MRCGASTGSGPADADRFDQLTGPRQRACYEAAGYRRAEISSASGDSDDDVAFGI